MLNFVLVKRSPFWRTAIFSICLASANHHLVAQTTAQNAPLPEAPVPQTAVSVAPPVAPGDEPVTFRGTPANFLKDQKAIWTSPFHLRATDLEYLAPLGIATGILLGSDQHSMNALVHTNATDQRHSRTFSDAGLASLAAVPAAMYGWSLFQYAPRAHETALLSSEAAANAYVVSEAVKIATRRERPLVGGARGNFGASTSWNDGSFPSNHAALAWSIASVIGSAYPGWFSRLTVYSIAGGVSLSRITAKEHFPSDVLVGSAAGWMIGHYVYRAHHNTDLDLYEPGEASQQGHPAPDPIHARQLTSVEIDPDQLGSTFVPMDSWIYPALDRLTAMGLISPSTEGIRPWTRLECFRQLQAAEDSLEKEENGSRLSAAGVETMIRDLRAELQHDVEYQQNLQVDSIYARYGTIAGPALSDSYHFGQTWQNDFGRPLGRGSSELVGASVRATDRRLFFFAREEYQGAARPEGVSQNTRDYIASLDATPVPGGPFPLPALPSTSGIRQQRALDLYAGVAFAGNAISFGKQELYWSPLASGALSFSSNAEPTYNLRFVSTRPHPLPIAPNLITYSFDFVAGKLSGHAFPQRPWFNGQKVTFNFGKNFEVGLTRWSVFAGVGHPMTVARWRRNIFSQNSTGGLAFGSRDDPGDRKSGFDFRYQLPGLHKSVTLYSDWYADDEVNPLGNPKRSAISPGIYFSRLPGLPRLDLRVESTSTLLFAGDQGGHFFYWNNQYLDANTNKGFILGSATGRDARSIEARSTYWFSGRSTLQAGYRQTKGGVQFLVGGATITDGFVNTSVALGRDFTASAFAQYERFLIPSINGLPATAGPQHNVSGWLQITYRPKWSLSKSN